MRWSPLLLLPFVLACARTGLWTNDGDAARDDDAAAIGDSSPALDAHAVPDASDSGSSAPLAPNPPAGSTKCGSGTISAMATSPPQAPGALSNSGGEWEVWCSPPNAVYVWARFEGVVNTGHAVYTCSDGTNSRLLGIDYGEWKRPLTDGSWTWDNNVEVTTYEADGTPIVVTPPNAPPETIVASTTISSRPNWSSTGEAHLEIFADSAGVCSRDDYYGVAAIDVTWTQ